MGTSTTIQPAPEQYTQMLDHYMAIVEKTNQQLSLWSNPYTWMITSLGVLFTVATIVAAYIIFRNSREYKRQISDFLAKQEDAVQKWMDEMEEQLDSLAQKAKQYEQKLDTLIQEYQKKLENAGKVSKEEVERIERMIDDLKMTKASLGSYVIPEAYEVSLTDRFSSLMRPLKKSTRCLSCGKNFEYSENSSDSMYRVSLMSKHVDCPFCGHQNIV